MLNAEIIEQVLRKEFGNYEKDYYIHGGSVYFVNLFRKLMLEVLEKIKTTEIQG